MSSRAALEEELRVSLKARMKQRNGWIQRKADSFLRRERTADLVSSNKGLRELQGENNRDVGRVFTRTGGDDVPD